MKSSIRVLLLVIIDGFFLIENTVEGPPNTGGMDSFLSADFAFYIIGEEYRLGELALSNLGVTTFKGSSFLFFLANCKVS